MKRFAVSLFTGLITSAGLLDISASEAAAKCVIPECVVHQFQGGTTDGSGPRADLLSVGPSLYGTTEFGGQYGPGTVFKVNPSTGAESIVHSFNGTSDGSAPESGLIQGLYGTTIASGSNGGGGTLFKIDRSTGAAKILHSFGAGSDGFSPYADYLLNVNGTLWGTTYYGGGSTNCGDGCGTVYSVNTKPPHTETVVHPFQGDKNGATDGAGPAAGLIDVNGILYGTTAFGGANNGGTIFSIDPSTGAEQVLYSFCSTAQCPDGQDSEAGLIYINGVLYGTTNEGGAYGYGTVFSFDPATGVEQVLHSFCYADNNQCPGDLDGWGPFAGLTPVTDPTTGDITLYGTTELGGSAPSNYCPSGCGTVFSVDLTTSAYQLVYAFQGDTDGSRPFSGLTAVTDRSGITTLYGTTQEGGVNPSCGGTGCGTVFGIPLQTPSR